MTGVQTCALPICELENIKKELKTLITQKVKELTANPGMAEIINETYASLQTEKMERISATQKTLQDLTKEPRIPTAAIKPDLQTALDILNEVLEQKSLTRTDMEVLVEKIMVDKDGNVDIYLKHGLGNLAAYDFKADKENLKLTMMTEAIRLLKKDETGFTSVKFLAESLKDMGYPMHKKKFTTYRNLPLSIQNRGFQGEIDECGKNVHHAGADWRYAGNDF